jgi:hypothetical protein
VVRVAGKQGAQPPVGNEPSGVVHPACEVEVPKPSVKESEEVGQVPAREARAQLGDGQVAAQIGILLERVVERAALGGIEEPAGERLGEGHEVPEGLRSRREGIVDVVAHVDEQIGEGVRRCATIVGRLRTARIACPRGIGCAAERSRDARRRRVRSLVRPPRRIGPASRRRAPSRQGGPHRQANGDVVEHAPVGEGRIGLDRERAALRRPHPPPWLVVGVRQAMRQVHLGKCGGKSRRGQREVDEQIDGCALP